MKLTEKCESSNEGVVQAAHLVKKVLKEHGTKAEELIMYETFYRNTA